MPETELVGELIKGARARVVAMVEKARTQSPKNSETAGAALREEGMHCTRCHLYQHATQSVFGEGPVDAALMLVGEQPGDQEDLAGHPFVGPAGRLLDAALEEAGIDRSHVYVTKVVKHFKWEPRGKRRMHKTPAQKEIDACHSWLAQELAAVKPKLVIDIMYPHIRLH